MTFSLPPEGKQQKNIFSDSKLSCAIEDIGSVLEWCNDVIPKDQLLELRNLSDHLKKIRWLVSNPL